MYLFSVNCRLYVIFYVLHTIPCVFKLCIMSTTSLSVASYCSNKLQTFQVQTVQCNLICSILSKACVYGRRGVVSETLLVRGGEGVACNWYGGVVCQWLTLVSAGNPEHPLASGESGDIVLSIWRNIIFSENKLKTI